MFASFVCNMIVDGIAYTFGIFLPKFVQHYSAGKGEVAWVGSLLSGVYLSAGPIVSALANKYGCRAVCIAGAVVASAAFALSTLSGSVSMLMLTYGVMGGFGFGMIYLPAVVAVGYYFETKRSLATGIAVCGSGFGTFLFAPFATYLLQNFDWKNANLILAGLILNCAIFGALMRPLTYPKEKTVKPLMQRMYEEKRMQMERGSIGGSYFLVQRQDGTMEKRMKLPINADPGVHSSLALDQMAAQQQGLQPVPTLPTITEAKVQENNENGAAAAANGGETARRQRPTRIQRHSESDSSEFGSKNIPRNASQPAFPTQNQGTYANMRAPTVAQFLMALFSFQPGLPKNGSVPTFDRVRKHSTGDRFKPSLAAIKAGSKADVENGEVRKNTRLKLSTHSLTEGRTYSTDDNSVSRTQSKFGNTKILFVSF